MNPDSERRGKRSPARVRALRAQVRETVQAAILDAAEQQLAERGMQGAALAQIAKRAGVAVGTLYNYFADREALIAALFESRRAQIRPALQAAAARSVDLAFEPRLLAFVHDVLAVFETHRKFIKLMIETEHLKVTPSNPGQDLRKGVEQVAAAGVAEGVIGADGAELFALVAMAALKGLAIRRISDGQPLLEDAEPLVTLLLDGARARR